MRREVLGISFVLSVVTAWAWGCSSAGDSADGGRINRPGDGGGGGSVFPGNDGGASNGGGFAGFGGADPGGTGTLTIDDCTGSSLPQATVAALQAGGALDPAMQWLYPYDGTVFPLGIPSPELQWKPQTGGTEAVYVHMTSARVDYKGCWGPTDPARISLTIEKWTAIAGRNNGNDDPLTVELTTMAGGNVSRLPPQKWTIATGTLKGAIYYNTYSSPQVGNNGAVMKVHAGEWTPSPLLVVQGQYPFGPCISCHSVSANGAVIAAETHDYSPLTMGKTLKGSQAFNLSVNPQPNAGGPGVQQSYGFSALFPDGSLLVTNGTPTETGSYTTGNFFPTAPGNNPGLAGPTPSMMFDALTGQQLPSQGLPQFVKMPSFSPDGTLLVFNNHDDGQGHTLALAHFDRQSLAFSGVQRIFGDPAQFPGWPFFTPDSQAVIFVLGDSDNYASIPSNDQLVVLNPDPAKIRHGNLMMVNNTGAFVPLARANGDSNLNYYPTVSPVAAGGYYWVFFTSRRPYGNHVFGKGNLGFADPAAKKLWVAAIDMNAPPGTDPSHPAFYLPGQEEGSGNIRAFAALEPCKQDGDSCTSGIDCCGGACSAEGKCTVVAGCAKTDEKCETASDCCDPSQTCTNHWCAQPGPR